MELRQMRLLLVGVALAVAAAQKVEWVQTARFPDGSLSLLKDMEPMTMKPLSETPERTLEIDTSKTYQEILGFGGAFTEASAINWRKLTKKQQEEVIKLYFASPEEGGHGYTLGRVPMNSCDFSPGSYSFDDESGDMDLTHFDMDVTHDVDVGMIPMMQEAQALVEKRGFKLNVYASPWSPPAWMKTPVDGKQSMVISASPNGLLPSMQRPWAKYFSKFISAYKEKGIHLWGVTVQNEPEAAVGWEAMLWTPKYMASFVKDHLGPVLKEDHPGLKIIGYDHNKDHLEAWAKGLYEDPEAAKWFDGIGVHWYGGLNTNQLTNTHKMAPDKMILATEACNCGGVVFKDGVFADGAFLPMPMLGAWWGRAEALALDILEDLRYWAVGWTDWNLILSPAGGPNHLKNLCDANLIADPEHIVSDKTIVKQASYYFMGHFSRYILPGSKRVALKNTVEAHYPPLTAGDVKNNQALLFAPCDGSDVQKWTLDETGSLLVRGTNEAASSDGFEHGGECMDLVTPPAPWIDGKIQTYACASGDASREPQEFVIDTVTGGARIFHPPTGKCVTAIQTDGGQVGLDRGVTIVAAQLKECLEKGHPSQTFELNNYDAQGFPNNFPVRTLPAAPGGGELCLQPQIARLPHFDAVAFEQPDGGVSLVAMNLRDEPVEFNIVDKASMTGVTKLSIPPHAIHTYKYNPTVKPSKTDHAAATVQAAAAPVAKPATAAAAVNNVAAALPRPQQPAASATATRLPAAAAPVTLATIGTASQPADVPTGGASVLTWMALFAGCAIAATAVLAAVRTNLRTHGATRDAWEACEEADDYEEFRTVN